MQDALQIHAKQKETFAGIYPSKWLLFVAKNPAKPGRLS
jgi:hypothetical protein